MLQASFYNPIKPKMVKPDLQLLIFSSPIVQMLFHESSFRIFPHTLGVFGSGGERLGLLVFSTFISHTTSTNGGKEEGEPMNVMQSYVRQLVWFKERNI